ncbi:MAG: 16S rRNA (guanine(527)-N(7))-methyltransferase RsmG [Phycisphaerae bacterium]|nr:16S rRNA (guanine(527)-N(7))-methyltransferase RsmG [Phycisphaerae bacterium]
MQETPRHAGPRRAPRPELPPPGQLAPLTPPPGFLGAARAYGIEFEAGEVEALGLYLALLYKGNETMNLTAVREPEQAWTRHVLDALTLVPLLAELPEGSRVIDVGSGGGIPGVPLAIVLPSLEFTLLEATGKKADFLSQAVAALGLRNARVINDRSERLAHDRGEKSSGASGRSERIGGHREAYDAAVIRAVGRLAVAAELTVPFVKPGGRVLMIKGERADEELAEAAGALALLKAVHEGTAQTPTGRIVVLGKRAATPKVYPRADGEPSRVPLGVARGRK